MKDTATWSIPGRPPRRRTSPCAPELQRELREEILRRAHRHHQRRNAFRIRHPRGQRKDESRRPGIRDGQWPGIHRKVFPKGNVGITWRGNDAEPLTIGMGHPQQKFSILNNFDGWIAQKAIKLMMGGGVFLPRTFAGPRRLEARLVRHRNAGLIYDSVPSPIDLHEGKVKQIVGSSLKDTGAGLRTNFETDRSPAYFAKLYQKDGLRGGHVIMLGKGTKPPRRKRFPPTGRT